MNFQIIEYLNELYNDVKYESDVDAVTSHDHSLFQIPISA